MTRVSVALVFALIGMVLPAHAQAPVPPASAPAEVKPNDYADEANWLCRPGRKGDACDVDLTTTLVATDGTLTRHPAGYSAVLVGLVQVSVVSMVQSPSASGVTAPSGAM